MLALGQLQAKMAKLQSQAEALIAKQSKIVLNDIRALMDKHGLTTADIEAHTPNVKKRGRPAGTSTASTSATKTSAKASKKTKMPAKYRDPETGAEWSGHARPPKWIASVRDRTKYLIESHGPLDNADVEVRAKPAAKQKAAAKRSRAAKKSTATKTTRNKAVEVMAIKEASAARKRAATHRTGREAVTGVAEKTATRKSVAQKPATPTARVSPSVKSASPAVKAQPESSTNQKSKAPPNCARGDVTHMSQPLRARPSLVPSLITCLSGLLATNALSRMVRRFAGFTKHCLNVRIREVLAKPAAVGQNATQIVTPSLVRRRRKCLTQAITPTWRNMFPALFRSNFSHTRPALLLLRAVGRAVAQPCRLSDLADRRHLAIGHCFFNRSPSLGLSVLSRECLARSPG